MQPGPLTAIGGTARLAAALLASVALHGAGAGLAASAGSPAAAGTPAPRLAVHLVAASEATPAKAPPTPPPGTAPTAGAASGIAARYFRPSELTERARIERIDPLEPPEILGLVGEGTLRLEILLDATGRPDAVRVLQSSAPEVFTAHAVAVFRQASFRPGRIFGRGVPSRLQIEISLAALRPEFISPIERNAAPR